MLLSSMLCSALLAASTPTTWDVLQIGHLFGPPSISISGLKDSGIAAEIVGLLPPARIDSQPKESSPGAVVAGIDDETVSLTIQLEDIGEFLSFESGLNGPSTWSVVFEGAGASELLEALKQRISPEDKWSWLQTPDGSLQCFIQESSGNPACIVRSRITAR